MLIPELYAGIISVVFWRTQIVATLGFFTSICFSLQRIIIKLIFSARTLIMNYGILYDERNELWII